MATKPTHKPTHKATRAETINQLKEMLDQANGRIMELRAQRDGALHHAEELAGVNARLAARSSDSVRGAD